MNLVMPIILFAVAIGVFRQRLGRPEWIALCTVIVIVLVRFLIKGPS